MRHRPSKRRHPAARGLVLVLGLVIMGGLYSVAAPHRYVSADVGTSLQVEQGRKLFAVGCASCHGLRGQGSSIGPALIGVGTAAVDFQVGTGRMPLPAADLQVPVERPSVYGDEEIAALAAYVGSLRPGGPPIPSPQQYDPLGLTAEQIARGGALFRTNCAGCHNFAGEGGALSHGREAPDLDDVSPKHLYEAMITGPGPMPLLSDEVMTPQDKRTIIAYLKALKKQPDAGGLPLGGIGPVSEGFWAWVAGMGTLVAATVWIAARGARTR